MTLLLLLIGFCAAWLAIAAVIALEKLERIAKLQRESKAEIEAVRHAIGRSEIRIGAFQPESGE